MSIGLPPKSQPTQCLQCGAEIQQSPGRGRLRQFCRPSHGRTWPQRMRSAGWL